MKMVLFIFLFENLIMCKIAIREEYYRIHAFQHYRITNSFQYH